MIDKARSKVGKTREPDSFFDVSGERIHAFIRCHLLQMRCFILCLQFTFNWWDFSTDAFKGVPRQYSNEFTLLDRVILRLLSGLNRWDAVHFLHIAEYGYTWEQNLAFFPLFPMMVRTLTYCWASPFLYLQLLHFSTVLLVCFVLSGMVLYRIVFNVTSSTKQALLSVLIFSINPASIFFSAAYSESLYCLLTFSGILLLLNYGHSKYLTFLLASIVFAFSFAARSNGFLNFGYVVWYCFIAHCKVNNMWELNKTPIFTLLFQPFLLALKLLPCFFIMLSVVHFHGLNEYQRFCVPKQTVNPSYLLDFAEAENFLVPGTHDFDWCKDSYFESLSFLPPWYTSIQHRYWDVGFFAYWKLTKLPCFLLAMPAFSICLFGVRTTFNLLSSYGSFSTFINDSIHLLPFCLHALFMALSAIFVYNVEVFTRIFFSSSPFPYLILAKWMSDLTPRDTSALRTRCSDEMDHSYKSSCSTDGEPPVKMRALNIDYEERNLRNKPLTGLEAEDLDVVKAWICTPPSNNPLQSYNETIEEWWHHAFDIEDQHSVDYQTNQFTREGIQRVLIWKRHQLRLNETPCDGAEEASHAATQTIATSIDLFDDKKENIDKIPLPKVSSSEKSVQVPTGELNMVKVQQEPKEQLETSWTQEQLNTLHFYNYWAPIILQLQLQAATAQQSLLVHAANYNGPLPRSVPSPNVSTPLSLPDSSLALLKDNCEALQVAEVSAGEPSTQETTYSPMQLDVPDNASSRGSVSMSISSGRSSEESKQEKVIIESSTASHSFSAKTQRENIAIERQHVFADSVLDPIKQSQNNQTPSKVSMAKGIEIERKRKHKSPTQSGKSKKKKRPQNGEESHAEEAKLLLLPTRQSEAQQLLVAARAKKLALIEGPIGSGKSFLAQVVADNLQVPIKILQMGDQTDSKSLFGAYHGTEVAGQFIWASSPFTKWLSEPCLILIEDIDHASSDVVSKIITLFEERIVTLPNGLEVTLHRDNCCLATISENGKRSCLLEGISVRVALSSFTDNELQRLVSQAFPRISHIARTLCQAFREVEKLPATGHSRNLTATEFIRGCKRMSYLSDLTDNITVFTELIDTWCLADHESRASKLCSRVASSLSISADQMNHHLNIRQPTLRLDDTTVFIGRNTLEREATLKTNIQSQLGYTKDVLLLMERIATCVQYKEPVLLVGETGVGKTSIVQALAGMLGVSLRVVNLSPTSDADELIEGYKPTSTAHLLEPFTKTFYELFSSSFDSTKNQKFAKHLEECLTHGRFKDYLSVVEVTAQKAICRLEKDGKAKEIQKKWADLIVRARRIKGGLAKNALLFTLTSGAVKEAADKGDWLLIDEINLASPECLDAIMSSVEHSHPNFRLFGCMNPATDAGKRRLPAGVRSKFTEFFVTETTDRFQLAQIVTTYLPSLQASITEKLVNFYLDVKKMFPAHFSLRTFCRALLFASDNIFGNVERSLHEAIHMAFLTNFEIQEKQQVLEKIESYFPRTKSKNELAPPGSSSDYVKVGGFWIKCGTEFPQTDPNYVVTKSVQENLTDVSRVICSGRFPVLLEGETSSGKTSMILYLAKLTGNKVIRINNHEHTDIQEYMGSYVADSCGRLVFREGALVSAVKKGYWVILDELNLAPTDVIEALNRLLDDNRELYIPEINKAVKAHPSFRLFATQNPAGTYAGRKRLSRALLSRFVVMRMSHLPFDELSSMVCTRCSIHPKAANKMIEVLSELRLRRSLSGVFSARDGLMTLRDVFRWAKRLAMDEKEENWLKSLANHGYFLLAGRCRNAKDVQTVISTLEKVFKQKIDADVLFSTNSIYFPKDLNTENIILTRGMRQMLVMTYQAWLCDEAVLIVGETGGGKTSLAEMMGKGHLLTLNCHERTETADLLGRLRPRDGGGFEWADGIVINAMREGLPLLIDEISLAEDSVLERLNPLFEENRSLLLTDAGVEVQLVEAAKDFKIIATMNPGGDYGKKELSKALRNRFTEIWSACDFEKSELLQIFDLRLEKFLTSGNSLEKPTFASEIIISWITSFFHEFGHVFRSAPSVRDIVACADLYAAARLHEINENVAISEAIHSCFLDGLSSLPSRISIDVTKVKQEADQLIKKLLPTLLHSPIDSCNFERRSHALKIGPFSIPFGPSPPEHPVGFSFDAPTCWSNFYRIARGLLISKPILLEGSPGCGKSSSVVSLARVTGHQITRVNLSEQTDLADLFGSDVPVLLPDGTVSFQWQDGPVLRAIKNGEWILLDEMNLASQSVLEGLNACFDHRHTLYIAEINRSFKIPIGSKVRFFACQNPRAQGGNRRALPKSFINRFTTIWIDDLTSDDIYYILRENKLSNVIDDSSLKAMIAVNKEASSLETLHGGPFTFNLRDLLRWIQLYDETQSLASGFDTLYVARMRNEKDKETLKAIFEQHFLFKSASVPAMLTTEAKSMLIGDMVLERKVTKGENSSFLLLPSQATSLYRLATCVKMGWLSLLIGPRNCGKKTMIGAMATLTGAELMTMNLSADTDAQELIGSYEQIIDDSHIHQARKVLCSRLEGLVDNEEVDAIRNAKTLMGLEAAVELALSTSKLASEVIDECQAVLEMAAKADIRFAWMDSKFVDAFVNGHWILLEDVNLCSGAVLDRLNSCLEADGELVIAERGDFIPLRRHADFRVFLSMDPTNGEISRAMRNRSVEIFVDKLWANSLVDTKAIVEKQAATNVNLSDEFLTFLAKSNSRNLLHFGVLLNGFEPEEAARCVGIQVDGDALEVSEKSCLHQPLTTEIVDLQASYLNWWFKLWTIVSADDPLGGLLMRSLAANAPALKSDKWNDSQQANKILNRVRRVIKSSPNNLHPIDSRFNGMTRFNDASLFAVNIFQEWSSLEIETKPLGLQSAENLSNTLSKYEMALNSFAFEGLPLLSLLIKEARQHLGENISIKKVDVTEAQSATFLLRLLMFCIKAREDLNERFGPAHLYIAWTKLQQLDCYDLISQSFPSFQTFSRLWSSDAFDVFVKHYLSRYKTARAVNPFENEETCQEFSQNLERVLKRINRMDDASESIKQEEEPIHLAQKLIAGAESLLKYFYTLDDNKSHELLMSLEVYDNFVWNSEYLKKPACISNLLNAFFFRDLTVFNLSQASSFFISTSAFWESFSYDPSMSAMKIRDLFNLSIQSLRSQFWRLAANAQSLQEKISDELSNLPLGLEEWVNLEERTSTSWKDRLHVGLAAMKSSCPPKETLDPLVFGEATNNYIEEYLYLVNRPLKCLESYRQLSTQQGPDCDANSPHPIISSLWGEREHLKMEINSDNGQQHFYRQKAKEYAALIYEMHSILQLTTEVSETLGKEDILLTGLSEIEMSFNQLNSFLSSVQSFIFGCFQRYSSFVDVSVTFIVSLSVLTAAVLEITSMLKTRMEKQRLITEFNYPQKLSFTLASNEPIPKELEVWAVADSSPLPLRLKARIVGKRSQESEVSGSLEWIKEEWKKWHEKYVNKAKEKEFVYRDKTQEERDDAEQEEFFENIVEDSSEILTANQLSELINETSTIKNSNDAHGRLHDDEKLALLWLKNLAFNAGDLPLESQYHFADRDLSLLTVWDNYQTRRGPLDVYRSCDHTEIKKALDVLKILRRRTLEVQERWPEVASLRLILEAIDEFEEESLTTNHMRLSLRLETVVAVSEEWIKLADRANTIKEQLAPIVELLLEWKKMEVRSWSILLERTEEDSKTQAQLVAYPLFERLFLASESDLETHLVPQAIEWIQHGVLVDYPTRIESVQSLSTWAKKLGKSSLSKKLTSVAAHFAQFASLTKARLDEMRSPIETALKDYVHIAKYNDLNLENIKASSKKAHIQLFKIIKKFKNGSNQPVGLLLQKLISIESVARPRLQELKLVTTNGEGRLKRAQQLSTNILEKISENCLNGPFIDFEQQVRGCDELVRMKIKYEGEDKDKEKQQGHENQRRQRAVAMVIKEAQSLGFNARRAVTISRELLTKSSITGLQHDLSTLPCEMLVRGAAAGRSNIVQQALTPNEQLGVHTRNHFVGMVEFGLHWQIQTELLYERLAQQFVEFRELKATIQSAEKNAKDGYYIDHDHITLELPSLFENIVQLCTIFEDCQQRCKMAPDASEGQEAPYLHKLSTLHRGHNKLELLEGLLDEASTLSNQMKDMVKSLLNAKQFKGNAIYAREKVESANLCLTSCTQRLQELCLDLSPWFEIQMERINGLLGKVAIGIEVKPLSSSENEFNADFLLLFIQKIYKETENLDIEKSKTLDRYDHFLKLIGENDVAKVITQLSSLVHKLAMAEIIQSLFDVSQLVSLCFSLFEVMVSKVTSLLSTFSACYHAVLSLTDQLFKEGYVNLIPKKEETKNQDGVDADGETGGMGEGHGGKDAKDVTDEMEETGQIEGLQGDEPETNDEGPSMENETPIEMEDDFPEELRDIDKNDQEKNDKENEENDEEEEEGEEPKMDDEMGQVDMPEEEKLDPKLWDEDDRENREKDIDQENNAADQETNELAAKEKEKNDQASDENTADATNEDKEENDIENVDEREQEDVEDDARSVQGDESNEQDLQNPDDVEEPEIDLVDKLDTEENEEMDTEESPQEIEPDEMPNEEGQDETTQLPEKEKGLEEKQEEQEVDPQGSSGIQNEEAEKQDTGAMELETEENMEVEEGMGSNQPDSSGQAGKGLTKETIDKKKADEEPTQNEQMEDRQEKATTDMGESEERDMEEGDGERNEKGELAERTKDDSGKQIIGHGSMEEARKSKRDEPLNERKRLQQDPLSSLKEDIPNDDSENEPLQESQAIVHLAVEDLYSLAEDVTKQLVLGACEPNQPTETRDENQISKRSNNVDALWSEISRSIDVLSAELAENLRLILEPQRATKLQGDYRSGKRLNMRRLIPYIASEYRKDRIWMKRTKKAQREYQILIAVDDSGSMNEFGMGRVTCESVCIVDEALRKVDAGQVQVVSFGENVRELRGWSQIGQPGSELLSTLQFEQTKTDLIELLTWSTRSLGEARTTNSDQLLIIISDGRGALQQGAEKVKMALRGLYGVTVLFVILDTAKKSIEEMSVASFENKQVKLTPYLALFPFPFYAVIKSVAQLPSVLSESIRQWFEMCAQNWEVAMTDHHGHHSTQTNATPPKDVVDQFIGQGINDFMAAMDGKEAASHSAHNGHEHMGHDSSGHDGGHHMMKMWFHGGYEEVILFECWRVNSISGMLVSCAIILTMGIAYEALKWGRVHLQTRLAKSLTPIHRRSFFQILLPCLYVIQLVLAYFLMLIAMTYNIFLTAAVILGGGIGHWVFAVIHPIISEDELAADSCH
ncbi:unnamed protein product, partial [Mesorhabditis belari]|uniref:Midasin n=1 Tax=Mesorhabditis belari TaxID=2138241 RepID=A0AAF3EGL2_9BILA